MKTQTEQPHYEHDVPLYMLEGPNLVHFDGRLAQPGHHNDYTFHRSEKEGLAICRWWNPSMRSAKVKLVSITRLDTGDRWAFSSQDGVYIDTRLEREMRRVARDMADNSVVLDPESAKVLDENFWDLI